jgi:NTP pyrophosphatase (non-canonical NTP hydrolase)
MLAPRLNRAASATARAAGRTGRRRNHGRRRDRTSVVRKLGGRRPPSAAAVHTIGAMQLSEYQRLSRRTAEYPREAWLAYPALGLAGEAGEVAEHAKKAIRDDGGTVGENRRAAMSKELGDVLWYVAQLASELDLDLEEIAQANLDKLLSRQRRGVLSGSGDDR